VRLALGLAVGGCALALLFISTQLRFIDSDEFGARLHEAVRQQLGGKLSYSELGYSFGSRQLFLRDIELHVGAAHEPVFRAPRATMGVALLPLLKGRVLLDSFHARDAEVWLVRGGVGWSLLSGPGGQREVAKESPLLLPLRVELRNASVWIEDSAATPPEIWRFTGVELVGRANPARRGLDLHGSGRLHGGGGLAFSGEVHSDRSYHGRVHLVGAGLASLAPVRSRVARGVLPELTGELEATAELEGQLGGEGRLRIELVVSEAEASFGGLRLRGRATAERIGWTSGPLSFVVDLDRGGRLSGRGDWNGESISNFSMELSSVAAAPFLPVVPDARQLSGTLSGRFQLTPSGGASNRLQVRLELQESVLHLQGARLAGTLKLQAELNAEAAWVGSEGPLGHFELDAGQAELDYRGVFHKPAGTPALLSGVLRRRPDRGLELRDLHWKIHGFQAQLGQ
jgi:hypothetical protein